MHFIFQEILKNHAASAGELEIFSLRQEYFKKNESKFVHIGKAVQAGAPMAVKSEGTSF